MKRLFLIVLSSLFISMLFGCTAQSEEPFTQVNMNEVDESIKSFVATVQENGVYLFGNQLDDNQYYILFNGIERKQKQGNIYFKNVYAETHHGTLKIHYSESDTGQSGQKQILYKIDKTQFPQDYNNIKLFKDHQSTDFTSIVVQEETP